MGRGPTRHRNGYLNYDVEDAEIVMAVFLHFCDSYFSPLAVAEEHRFGFYARSVFILIGVFSNIDLVPAVFSMHLMVSL